MVDELCILTNIYLFCHASVPQLWAASSSTGSPTAQQLFGQAGCGTSSSACTPLFEGCQYPCFLAFSSSSHCESGIPSVNIVHIVLCNLQANLMLSVALSFVSISGKLRDSFKTTEKQMKGPL